LETTLIWTNIVSLRRRPIRKGRVYEVQDFLPAEAGR